MRKSLIALAAVAAFGVSFSTVRAEEAKKMEMTGVLIDNHCGEEMAKKEGATSADIQKAAEGHKKGCLMKCAKDDKSVALMSDGKMMKLDTASAEKAMAYLEEKSHKPAVTVEATKNEDGTLALAEIKPAKEAKKEEKKAE
jgi:hypothetical protein